MRSPKLTLILLLAMAAVALETSAWTSIGHRLITRAAVASLDLDELDWSESELETIEGAAVQPDLMRPRKLRTLRDVEAPRHYLDLELLAGQPLPERRWEYERLLNRIAEDGGGGALLRPGTDVSQVGVLPYSLVEATERLAAIFAQLRVRPENPDLRAMAAHQAGFVAHYAQDLCQPLHTTVHHDGRARKDLTSPHTGIHRQVDGLLSRVQLQSLAPVTPRSLEPLFAEIVTTFQRSHSEVDRIYGLVAELSSLYAGDQVDPDLEAFAQERYAAAVGFTADLIFTAWQLSTTVELPEWYSGVKRSTGHQQ